MYILFLGPPGSGKGTYSRVASDVLKIPILATGDMLRNEVEKGTELGRTAERCINAGELVPDEVMFGIIENVLSHRDYQNGVIFDGFPRTLAQAKMLDEILDNMGTKVNVVIELFSTDDEIVERLSNRRVCPKCGRIYHLINMPPKVDEICDDDGEKLIQREDDKPDTIRNRLKVYHSQTAPIIEYYKEKDDILYLEIDTNGPPEVGRNRMLDEFRKIGLIN
ncbi:adenylate kinase [bacterium]|nr:adenylate kinase [bacterium]